MAEPIVFLDNNSTTRVLSEVIEAMQPYWTEAYFNPASVVGEIAGCMSPIYEAKQALCKVLNAGDPSEFTLTSGATEANNWVLRSVLACDSESRGTIHFIVSAIEHPSILEAAIAADCHPLVDLTLANVNSDGVINIDDIMALIRPETRLISIMLANNETGVIQPVGELAQQIKQKYPECMVHTDATQAIGKIPVDLTGELGSVDFLSLSAHKFHGPKGIGALFIRRGRSLAPLLLGGGQQEGRRAGTDNPSLAAGMAAALRKLTSTSCYPFSHIASLLNDMETQMEKIVPGLQILGRQVERLPNTTLAIFPNMDGELLVHQLAEHGIAVSTGSACAQGSDRPSHVVMAMSVDYEKARNTLRISLSRYTTEQDISFFISVLSRIY
ncbi:MAG: cysteine desulfurase [Methylobacter tundripaludum]|nr:cysteine desulfurase [Methylobacter tundripaludum]